MSIRTTYHGYLIKEFGPQQVMVYDETKPITTEFFSSVSAAKLAIKERTMPPKSQFNVRLPDYTIEQIERLQQTYGLTQVQVVILAVDRFISAVNPETGDPAAIPLAETLE